MAAKPKNQEHMRNPSDYRDGYSDHFEPLEALDLEKCNSISDILTAMKKTSFLARTVGEAADVLELMARDKDCFTVLTLSGAMTAAKMGLVICDMIDNSMVDAIVSTGALMAHGFIESTGMAHFKYTPGAMKDEELYQKGYDRIYDTLELEKNLDNAEVIMQNILNKWDENDIVCSYKITRKLGEYLVKNSDGRGVLKSAYNKNVPVYIPAYTDSEFGLDFGIHRRKRKMEGKEPLRFDPFLDLEDFTEHIINAKKLGIFTIGGGVPRNWSQQVAPYLDIINSRIGVGGAFKRYQYAVRICPESVNLGGLSGSTYSEAVSWGKFVPASEGGRHVEVPSDATLAWPLIVKAVLERLKK